MRQWTLILSGICILLLCCCSSPATGWECNNGDPINDDWLCDDQTDCADGSDETAETCSDIKPPCAESQFRCNNSRCIDISFRCDGEPDCSEEDFSDEFGCNTGSEPHDCKGTFMCGDGTCLTMAWVCDGERDCSDSSDELHCPCNNGTYGCLVRAESFCLQNFTKCDGIPHCDDGRDEDDCNFIATPGDDFECPSQTMYKCRTGGECIFWKLVCDGYGDCKDSSDEGGLCHVNDCGHREGLAKEAGLKKACEQYCYESPDGGVCVCAKGFKLADDGIHCLDIDECGEMHYAELHNVEKFKNIYSKFVYEYGIKQVCSQNCRNLPGEFRCTCVEGYQIDADDVTCKAVGDHSPDLYVGIDNEIRVFSLRGSGEKTLYYDEVYKSNKPDESIINMDVNAATSAIFWIEAKSGRLRTMIGADVRSYHLDFKPTSVCVDWVTGNLYVSTKKKEPNHAEDHPAVFLLAESKRSTAKQNNGEVINSIAAKILSVELDSPVALAVYPQKGVLVIADAGRPERRAPRILIASMDGSNVVDLVTKSVLTPTDLVIDYVAGAVIWTSVGDRGQTAKIESIRLDGTQRGVIMSSEKNRFPIFPVSVATFEDRMYVSDRTAREVRSWKTNEITLYGEENAMFGSQSVIKQRRSRLGSIRISHPVLQRPIRGENLCRSAGCSHICVMVPTASLQIQKLVQHVSLRAFCLCPMNYQLIGDNECKAKVPGLIGAPTSSDEAKKTPAAVAATFERLKKCAALQCGPLARCMKGGNKRYECQCLNEESTGYPQCLPPRNAIPVENSTTSPSPQSKKSRHLTTSMIVLIVVAVILFIFMITLVCRCMRKNGYSVNLHFVRGFDKKSAPTRVSNRDSSLIVRSTKGKPVSITNPSYASPSQRKRLPKPVLQDDSSVSDSGIQRSFESGSLSATSDTSAGEGTSGSVGARARTSSPLLDDDIFDDTEVLDMGELGMRDSSATLGARLGELFKIRKTESRECMLPQGSTSKKSKSWRR